ncbi:tripartite tricarboxylate transporter substrate-binding protein, partial [Acinetobacter baumannii]
NILVGKKDLFSADLKELFAAFKKEPRKYTYASAGFGTTLHLSGEMMNAMAGVEVMHVPYKGAGPALNDLLGGRVDMIMSNSFEAIRYVQENLPFLCIGSIFQKDPQVIICHPGV